MYNMSMYTNIHEFINVLYTYTYISDIQIHIFSRFLPIMSSFLLQLTFYTRIQIEMI